MRAVNSLEWFVAYLIFAVYLVSPGRIEGWIWPAAAPASITDVQPDGNGVARFWGRSERLRPECSFAQIEWFLGQRTGQSVPVVIATVAPKVRDNGPFEFGPWLAEGVPYDELVPNSYADVLHRCRIFADENGEGGLPQPWLTRSPFWN